MLPKLLVLDLDALLWSSEPADAPRSPEPSAEHVRFYPEAGRALQRLLLDTRLQGIQIGITSGSSDSLYAHRCLDLLEFDDGSTLAHLVSYRELHSGSLGRTHFPNFQRASGLAYSELAFIGACRYEDDCEEVASECPGVLCVRAPKGLTEALLVFALASFAAGKSGVVSDMGGRRGSAVPVRSMLARNGFKLSKLKDCVSKGMYDCSWKSARSGVSRHLFSNEHVTEKGHVHQWTTVSVDDGSFLHSFTSVLPPTFEVPAPYPAPPMCPPNPGAVSDKFWKQFLQQEWDQFHAEEEQLKKDADDKLVAEIASMKCDLKEDKKQAVRIALESLDEPSQMGFATKLDEGSDVIARSDSGRGRRALTVEKFVHLLVEQDFREDNFRDFLTEHKPNYAGRDVKDIVSAYIDATSLPPNRFFEKELTEVRDQAAKDYDEQKAERVRAQEDKMRSRGRDDTRTKEAWAASWLSTPEWQSWLEQAETWVERCEDLHLQWDGYDMKRLLWKRQFGGDVGFTERAIIAADLRTWAGHPVLEYAGQVGFTHLGLRWESVVKKKVVTDPPSSFPVLPDFPEQSPPTESFWDEQLNETEEWERWHAEDLMLINQSKDEEEAEQVSMTAASRAAKKEAIRDELEAIDCPQKAGFTVKTDEGPEVIARSGEGGSGAKALQMEAALKIVGRLRLKEADFESFVESDRDKFVEKPLVDLFDTYFDIVDISDEAELVEARENALKKRDEEHEMRLQAQTEKMRRQREEHAPRVRRLWAATFVSRPEWQTWLKRAELWVYHCEQLQLQFDEYDRVRLLWKAAFGQDSPSFAPRKRPVVFAESWEEHPVLCCLLDSGVAYQYLAQRWQATASKQSVFDAPPSFPSQPAVPLLRDPTVDYVKKFIKEEELWQRWHLQEQQRLKAADAEAACELAELALKLKAGYQAVLKKGLAARDCSRKKGWTVALDCGPEVIARCACTTLSFHKLNAEDLAGMVAELGFNAEHFLSWLGEEKGCFEGERLENLLRAYIDFADRPRDLTFEASFTAAQFRAARERQRCHCERLEARQAWTLARLEENFAEAKAQLESTLWEEFLPLAELWVVHCEVLHAQWDAYDRRRELWQSDFGSCGGFCPRPSPPMQPVGRWFGHPVLERALPREGCEALARRWERVANKRFPD
eukprot:TRINITY_DN16932_c0_g1_i1.p1 TRINITY_DN16932_c0_g1~~TRINITY_DN16932_c0_g1_i1.p1  ORF type:complete len:1168 (+),score=250.93 TRINITY_DN16932_c0_g1_i1:28-3504(+)